MIAAHDFYENDLPDFGSLVAFSFEYKPNNYYLQWPNAL
jgi:hypothetical protein